MPKVVINRCYGGFSLSEMAENQYRQYAMIEKDSDWCSRDISRDDQYLVKIVEELGELADGGYATLKVVDIPDDVEWYVEEYDGMEWVAEKHRTWE